MACSVQQALKSDWLLLAHDQAGMLHPYSWASLHVHVPMLWGCACRLKASMRGRTATVLCINDRNNSPGFMFTSCCTGEGA